ncbi:hypothetical protein GGS24DRAFT_509775 [Hypoxylon argillaceum]|nr:hypothetical protein GGS24DRAFT_509775 [Hypoxylon argillaceum]
MATAQSINCVRDLDPYLDAKVDDRDTILEFICQICRRRRLTISTLAKAVTLDEGHSTGLIEPLDQVTSLYVHGFEQTMVLPCGHVFGDRCIREKLLDRRDFACPSCGFQMAYISCGHAIAPAVIPLRIAGCIRDTFPLTMPEAIQARLRYALNSECVICAQRARAGVQPGNSHEHDVHYTRHMKHGIRDVLGEIMMLVQPDFITRHTNESAQKTEEEEDRRQVNTALLEAIVLTELDDTIWKGTAMKKLTGKQVRRHAVGVRIVESHVLGLLADTNKNCRRMW